MRITTALLPLPFVALTLLAAACAKTSGGGGEGGDNASGGAGGGAAQCEDQPCGAPCATCDEPPCNQVCDGNGECRSDYNVTCSVCPDGEIDSPSTGDDCPYVDLVCEYSGTGEQGFHACRDKDICTINGWADADSEVGNDCYYWDANATCPMVFPQHGSPCGMPEDYGDLCDYGGGNFCACTSCLSGTCGGSYTWACVGPPPEPCPTEAPLLGHACVDEGLSCLYGAEWLEIEPDNGANLLSTCRACEAGIWVARETLAECY